MRFSYIVICCCLFLLASCRHKEAYFAFQNLQNNTWQNNNILSFEVDSALISKNKNFDILLEINHTLDYPYINLALGYKIIRGDSLLMIDKKNIEIADKNGKYIGKGFFSNFQLTDTLKSNFHFGEPQSLTIELSPLLKDDEINGISRIGIRLVGR